MLNFAVYHYSRDGKVLSKLDTTAPGDTEHKIHTWPFTAIRHGDGQTLDLWSWFFQPQRRELGKGRAVAHSEELRTAFRVGPMSVLEQVVKLAANFIGILDELLERRVSLGLNGGAGLSTISTVVGGGAGAAVLKIVLSAHGFTKR